MAVCPLPLVWRSGSGTFHRSVASFGRFSSSLCIATQRCEAVFEKKIPVGFCPREVDIFRSILEFGARLCVDGRLWLLFLVVQRVSSHMKKRQEKRSRHLSDSEDGDDEEDEEDGKAGGRLMSIKREGGGEQSGKKRKKLNRFIVSDDEEE